MHHFKIGDYNKNLVFHTVASSNSELKTYQQKHTHKQNDTGKHLPVNTTKKRL